MSLQGLAANESQVVFECLRAASEGPFFDDDYSHCIFGVHRTELAVLVDAWPNIDESDAGPRCAIINSMNNLLRYPHRQWGEWDRFISVSPEEVGRISSKWREGGGGGT